jgi:hypothetical protein
MRPLKDLLGGFLLARRGPEIARDGRFRSAAGVYWGAAGGVTIPGDGTWNITNSTSANPNSLQQTGAKGAMDLELLVTVSSYTAGTVRVRFYNPSGLDVDSGSFNLAGSFAIPITTTAAWDGRIGIFCGVGSTLQITSLSLRQVFGKLA